MKLSTTRFGEIEVSDDRIIHFPEGIIGFEECTRFTLLEKDDNATVWWLQSLDRPEVAFILTNPLFFMPDYNPKCTSIDHEILKIDNISQSEVSVIMVVQREISRVTANLLAPVLINNEKRLGKQTILRESGYSAVHPIMQTGVTLERRNV